MVLLVFSWAIACKMGFSSLLLGGFSTKIVIVVGVSMGSYLEVNMCLFNKETVEICDLFGFYDDRFQKAKR